MQTDEIKPFVDRKDLLVKLRNGTTEVKPLVSIVMHSIRQLLNDGKALVVYDLAMICRDSSYKPFGQAGTVLKNLKLVEESGGKYHVHESIKNIVLSSATGEGLDMQFGNPQA